MLARPSRGLIIYFNRWKEAFSEQQSHLENKDLLVNLKSVKSMSSSERYYCPKCGLLLVKDKLWSHDGHGILQNISDSQLERPTTLLCPIDDRKSHAVS